MTTTDVPFNTRLAARGVWIHALLRSAVGAGLGPTGSCAEYLETHNVKVDRVATLGRLDAMLAWLAWYPVFLLGWLCPPFGRYLFARVQRCLDDYMLAAIIADEFKSVELFVGVLAYLYMGLDGYRAGHFAFPVMVARIGAARENMTRLIHVPARPPTNPWLYVF